jgi:hypothetical protein
MKLGIISTRTFDNYRILETIVSKHFTDINLVISVGTKGADNFGLSKEDFETNLEHILQNVNTFYGSKLLLCD